MRDSMRRAAAQTGLGRPVAIASIILLSSLPLFADVYYHVFTLVANFDLLSSSGAYPLAMLLFLFAWLLSCRKKLISTLSNQDSRFGITRFSALGLLLLAASLTGRALLKVPALLVLQLFLLLGFLQGCAMLAFPETSKMTLKALALYVVSASIPAIASTFFDRPISLGFTSNIVPFLNALGYPVKQSEATILLELPSGQVSSLLIDSACAGPASYSIFIFLNGLMLLDLGAERKRFALFTLAGLATLYVLNLLRVAAIVHATFYYGEAAGQSVHLYLGYVLFTAFYLVYALLFARYSYQRAS